MYGKYTIPRFAAALVVAAMMTAAATSASAAIVGVTDTNRDVTINTDIPATVYKDPSDATLRLWDEKQDVVLDTDLSVNLLTATGSGGVIEAGTIVSVHMIQWDGLDGSNLTDVYADIEFASEIIGVISGRKKLRRSDYLGLDSITYMDFEDRGLENRDDFEVLADGVTMRIAFSAPDPGDWIRVITAANPVPVIDDVQDDGPDCDLPEISEVPAPAALPAGLAMIAAVAARRRRR